LLRTTVLAGGAIQALEEHKLAGKVLVSGQDADLAAIIRILDGTQTMTIYKPLGSQANSGRGSSSGMGKRRDHQDNRCISIGDKTIPATSWFLVIVTKDNVKQTVIKEWLSESGNNSEELAEREVAQVDLRRSGSAEGYFRPQKEASGFTSSKPASHASWLRRQPRRPPCARFLDGISRTRLCRGTSAPTTARHPVWLTSTVTALRVPWLRLAPTPPGASLGK